MANLNKVFLMGNLTRNPELRYTPGGTPVTEFGLAVNRVWTGKDKQRHEETVFVDVTLWARLAEIASEYLSKGRPVFIEGRLQLDQWETPDGQKRSKLRVVGETMQFLGARGESGSKAPPEGEQWDSGSPDDAGPPARGKAAPVDAPAAPNDEIPF